MRPPLTFVLAFVTMFGTEAMAQPNPPVLTYSTYGTTVRLTWRWPTGAGRVPTAVTFEAGSSPGSSDIAVFTVPAFPTGYWVTAPPGTYFVRARTHDPTGVSGSSDEVIITVRGTCPVPAAPTNLSASIDGTFVELYWSAPEGATSYVIHVGSVPGGSDLARFETGRGYSAYVPDGIYYVRVVGRNPCGTGAASNEIAVSVIAGPVLEIVNLPTAVPWSGAPIDEPVCAGVANTWFYDVLLRETADDAVTLTATVFRVDGDLAGYIVAHDPIAIPAGGTARVSHHFCFVQPTLHSVKATFVGHDAAGRRRAFEAPMAWLLPRP